MNNNSLAFGQAIQTQQPNNIHKIGLPYTDIHTVDMQYTDSRYAIYTQYTCNIHTILP